MNFDYDLFLHFSLKYTDDIDMKTSPVEVPLVKGVSWFFHAKNNHSRDRYNDAKLTFHLTSASPSNIIQQGLSYSLKITSLDGKHFESLQSFRPLTYSENFSIFFKSPNESNNLILQEVLNTYYKSAATNLKIKFTLRSPKALSPYLKLLEDIASPELADFAFQVEDEELKAHKFILSARSPIFRSMLSNDSYEETKNSMMKICDAPKSSFKLFLEFLYTAQLPTLPINEALEVLKIADKYDVSDLKKICDDQVIAILKPEDPVHEVYQFAHTYKCSRQLLEKTFNYIGETLLKGKILSVNLIDKPDSVNELVETMKAFNENLKRKNDEVEADEAAKKLKLAEAEV